jgi:hypothetical protein
MKSFACPRCHNKVYFESITCLKCKQALGFDAATLSMVAVEGVTAEDARISKPDEIVDGLRYCANASHGVCNWLTAPPDANGLCVACDLNRTIPNLSEAGSLPAWRDLERAKKRLLYSLLRFGLPLDASTAAQARRLTFDFARNIGTGHLGGVITIDVIEADAVEREKQRQHFGEPYRTLLGHLRHESGHFYWMVLIEGADRLERFRTVFGDERQNYQSALGGHHAGAVPADWQALHVSAYSSSHPWEDWAETWAHYLHMIDAVDTAESEGMEPRAAGFSLGSIWPFKKYDIYREESFHTLMERWIPLTIAMNSISRSMGHEDFYPFVISAAVYDKLAFVHRIIREQAARSSPRRKEMTSVAVTPNLRG